MDIQHGFGILGEKTTLKPQREEATNAKIQLIRASLKRFEIFSFFFYSNEKYGFLSKRLKKSHAWPAARRQTSANFGRGDKLIEHSLADSELSSH